MSDHTRGLQPLSYFVSRDVRHRTSAAWGHDAVVTLCLVQGLYLIFTGLWPLIDIFAFQLITGPILELWLVKIVGVLTGVCGAVLASAAIRRKLTLETAILALGTAGGLGSLEALYALRHRIGWVYAIDAAIHGTFLLLWLALGSRRSRRLDAGDGALPVTTASSTGEALDCRFVAGRGLPDKI